MSRLFAVLSLLVVAAGCRTADITGRDTGVQPLHVSADGHRIVREDGTAFIWLGDTAWELFHRLNREEADFYLENRARKGFNVIQAVVLPEYGITVPDPYGEIPLADLDPTRPNEAYFRNVDYIVDKAASLGLYVGMLPTWGDKWNKKWGLGPEIFTPENARTYGEWLGRRYRDKPIIWILGGDRAPENDAHLAIIRAMAEGIEAGTGGTQLITFHPWGESQSSTWFHGDAWLDFNMFQSGHARRDIANYSMTASDYARTPANPVIDGEPRYEDHPVNWDPKNGWFNDFDVRQAAYWSMLSGAAGHTYGDHDIWQMFAPGREPISSARTPWRKAIDHPGSFQMSYMHRLFASRPFLELVPDPSMIARDNSDGPAHEAASFSSEGRYALAYSAYGRDLTIDLRKLAGDQVRAWWYDPRTGEATEIGTFARSGTRTFDPPGDEGRGNDWVLVLDNAAQGYAAPGS